MTLREYLKRRIARERLDEELTAVMHARAFFQNQENGEAIFRGLEAVRLRLHCIDQEIASEMDAIDYDQELRTRED